jgi:hypothetical protein
MSVLFVRFEWFVVELGIAAAEYGKVDICLTVDDNFLKRAARAQPLVTVANPVTWFMEEMNND